MRDIIYRGKRKDNGEWVEGYYARICETSVISTGKLDLTEWNNIKAKMFVIIPETVGQYTGLTDKNGKKIFEGDIVKLTDDYNDFEWKAVVVFGNPGGAYCWGWNFLPIDGYKGTTDILMWVEMEATGAYCEVIGNIYDNPELMKGRNNNG